MSDNTRDLSQFGYRELDIAGDLLKAFASGREGWADQEGRELEDDIQIEFNPNSGNVFLVDDEFNVAMLNNEGKLENWVSCRACDNEGFRSEIKINDEGYCEDCEEVNREKTDKRISS